MDDAAWKNWAALNGTRISEKELFNLLVEAGYSEHEAKSEMFSLTFEFHWMNADLPNMEEPKSGETGEHPRYPFRIWWVEEKQEFRVLEQAFIPPHLL